MTAVQFIPVFLFSLPAGIIIEKYPKRKIIIMTQTLQLICASLIFILVFTGQIKFSYILILVFCIGTVQSLDNPARQAFVVEMVEGRDHLLNAIALNSAAFNAARLVGPAIAGMIMAGLGGKWCFFLNAVSFVAVIIGLFMMSMEDIPSKKNIDDPLKEIIEGLKYIRKTPALLYTIISLTIIPTFCINFNILIPPFTRDILGMQEKAYAFLISSLGFGALISAITVATRGKRSRAFIYQVIGALGIAVTLIIMGFVKNYYLSSFVLAICGFFMIMYSTTSNSVLQLNAPDDMRGRIMSVFSLVNGGLIPLGAIYAGTASKYLGPDKTFLVSGIIGLIGFSILFSRRKELKK
jgi:predicted MFS family arabinose efflux permease